MAFLFRGTLKEPIHRGDLVKEPPPIDKIIPTDHKLLCKECGSDQPFFSLCLLYDYALRDGKVVSERSGERVSCQACGATFTIGKHGTFFQHPEALPYYGPPRAKPQAHVPADAPPKNNEPPRGGSPLGVPLKRPQV